MRSFTLPEKYFVVLKTSQLKAATPKALSLSEMAVLLQTAAGDLSQWAFTGHRPGNQVTVCELKLAGAEALVQLVPASDFESIKIPFAPNSYKEDLPRKGITFNISEGTRLQLKRIEERVQMLLMSTWPQAQWHSALKPSDRYPTALRAKIRVRGARACRFYNAQGEAVPAPQEGEWDGVKCVPIVSIGAYVGDGVAGLLLDVQALMLGERTVVPPIDFSFLG